VETGTSRSDFLRNIRQAIGKTDASPEPSNGHQEERARKANAVRERLKKSDPRLLDLLANVAGEMGWQVHPVASPKDAARVLREIAQEKGATSVLHSNHRVLQRVELAQALPGIDLTLMEARDDNSWAALREQAPQADLGITGVDYAVAETGTCVFLAKPRVSRMTSLLPPVHIALVEGEYVLENLDDLFTLLGADYDASRLAPYLNLVSGPSRTGDIEQTIVIGAHGPKEAHMVIIG
jgi:L-lactate dehydrogenase complex protein LldG